MAQWCRGIVKRIERPLRDLFFGSVRRSLPPLGDKAKRERMNYVSIRVNQSVLCWIRETGESDKIGGINA